MDGRPVIAAAEGGEHSRAFLGAETPAEVVGELPPELLVDGDAQFDSPLLRRVSDTETCRRLGFGTTSSMD